jgi:rod shape determining protein RodA
MKKVFRVDLGLVIPALLLSIISLTILSSINLAYFKSQLISLVVSLIAFGFFSQLDTHIIRYVRMPIYIISLVLLTIIFIDKVGIESRGATRWISLLGVSVQISEIVKPFLAVAFASFLSEDRTPSLKFFFLTLLLLLPVIFLIYFQPDLGNALIYLGAAIFVLLVAGVPLRWFGLAILPVVVASPLLWSVLHEYQRQRLLTFFHPHSDPLGASYNAIQAIIAVGSGSFAGKGLSQGTQSGLKFLPEGHTDFIFATLSESLGFIGSICVILLSAFLCYRIYLIFKNSNDPLVKLFAACTFAFFLIQFVFNVGMNVGYLPIVGVTLPFVSFGGNSLLASFIFLGLLCAMDKSDKHKNVLEIR